MRNERHQVLLYGFGRSHDELAGRVVLLGYRTLRANDLATGIDQIRRQAQPVRVFMFPPEAQFAQRASDLASLAQAVGASGLRMIVSGLRPAESEIAALKRDGARFCVWSPFNDSELRFVLNSSLYDETRGEVRPNTRVPTSLIARVKSGAGEKPGLLCNLSTTGAFVETHRPSVPGGHVQLTIEFPDGPLAVPAAVVFANVPGNLQRSNVSIGMGVRFEGMSGVAADRVARFVAERVRAYQL